MLMKADKKNTDDVTDDGEFEFEKDGDIENDDYDKESIYSLLYAMYANAGTVTSDRGVDYEFTFNTWGISPSTTPKYSGPSYGPEDPQRHGKAAYAGLVSLAPAKAYLAANGDKPKIVEIGWGRGR
jgi:hypothetical protein